MRPWRNGWRLTCFLVVLQLSSSVAWPARSGTLQREVEKYVTEAHLDPEVVRPVDLAAEAERMVAAGMGRGELNLWLGAEIYSRAHAFAPIAPEVDRTFKYHLPYDLRFPRLIGQAAGGVFSHTGRLFYAIDFVLPLGTEVRAARRGVVALVVDGFTERGLGPEEAHRANVVVVLHKDGSFAEYAHLAPGIPVKTGDKVKGGQVIGTSDQTGFAGVPHLHFSVSMRRSEREFTTIPVRFRGGPPAGTEAAMGTFPYQHERETAKLAARVADIEPTQDGPPTVNWGDALEVRVQLLRGDADPVDVTASESLLFHSVSPQCLVVAGPGALRIAPDEGFEPWKGRECLAILWLVYRDRKRGDVAFLKMLLPVEAAPPAPR